MSIDSNSRSDPLVSWSVPYPDRVHGTLAITYRRDAMVLMWRPLQLIARTAAVSPVYLLAMFLVETALHPDPSDPGKLQPLPAPVADSLRTVYAYLPHDVGEPYRSMVIAAHHLSWCLFENDDYRTALLVFRYGPAQALNPTSTALRDIMAYEEAVTSVFDWLLQHQPWRTLPRRPGGAP